MSHTFYDSPEGADPSLSIDVTPEYCWFFEHAPDGSSSHARVRKEELQAIWLALGNYLRSTNPCRSCGAEPYTEHAPACYYSDSAFLQLFERDHPLSE